MNSNDIYEKVAEKMIELSCDSGSGIKIAGIPVVIAVQSNIDQADFYRRALYDYTIEKLEDSEENKVVVEDLGFLFSRLENQFTSSLERSEFYNNYICSILGAYNEMTGVKLTWKRVSDDPLQEPSIVDEALVTGDDIDNCDVAVWLFRHYETELRDFKNREEQKQKTKTHKKTRWGKWGK